MSTNKEGQKIIFPQSEKYVCSSKTTTVLVIMLYIKITGLLLVIIFSRDRKQGLEYNQSCKPINNVHTKFHHAYGVHSSPSIKQVTTAMNFSVIHNNFKFECTLLQILTLSISSPPECILKE